MDIKVLVLTAVSVGFIHTLLGPDHYIPFVAMSRARGWSYPRTALITALGGLGHVSSSVLIGFAGLWLGVTVAKLQYFEGLRGNVAGWLLLAFGGAYFIWGLRRAFRGGSHGHRHSHGDGAAHEHPHSRADGHVHTHLGEKANITPWILFTVFVLGPCEPLIPLVMYPAARHSWAGVAAVAVSFTVVTVGTMLASVLLSLCGAKSLNFSRVEKYTHALAGFAVMLCGGAVVFLGL